jgi:fibronectin type 3 domain-containing protein
MKQRILAVVLLISSIVSAQAQKKHLPFFVGYENGKAYLLLVDRPGNMMGFQVSRKAGEEFQRLTEEPITAEKDPAQFRDLLGSDYEWLSKALKTENELQTLRRIQSDNGVAFAWSLTSTRIAHALGRLFIDSTAQEGETYTYRVSYVGYNGKEIGQKDLKTKMESSTLTPPDDVKTEPGDEKVKLTWNYPEYSGDPEDHVMGFNIYRSEGENPPQLVNNVLILRQTGKLSRIDDKLQSGVTYSYVVKAVSWLGRESEGSKPVAVFVKDIHPPDVPKNFTATALEGRVRLHWDRGLEPDLSHYDLYRGSSSQGEFVMLNPRPIPHETSSFDDTAVVFGPHYFYKAKAIDRSGNESKFTAAHPARPNDTMAPLQPLEVTAAVQDKFVRVQWKRSHSSDVMGYYVYRGSNGDNLLRLVVEPLDKDSLAYIDIGYHGKGMKPGATFRYAVASVDNAHNESPKVAVLVKIPDTEPPAPPVDFHAHATNTGEIDLGWQPSPSLDVASFRLYRGLSSDSLRIVATMRGYTYRDSAVTKGRMYSYQLSAIDSNGNESKPTAPVIVGSTTTYLAPLPDNIEAVATSQGVTLSWRPVDPRELMGYNVYRSTKPSGVFENVNPSVITSTSYIDPGGNLSSLYRVSSMTTSGHENKSGKAIKVRGGGK